MDAEQTRRALLVQHERIRTRMSTCVELARRLRCGERVQLELDALLDELRHLFEAHNELETRVVRGLLEGSPEWGDVLVDRMLEEHVAEHAAFWDGLAGTALEVADRMAELADELDAHMAAEERTFLSPGVLHDAVIARRIARAHDRS